MSLTEHLPVYHSVYQLICLIFKYTHDYPREYKYSLGQDMKRDAIILVRSIYRANRSNEKQVWLEEFLDSFEILKLEIRLSVDLRLLSIRHQSELSILMESIGKQITGWKKWQQK